MKTNDSIINKAAKIGNLYLVKYFFEKNRIPKDVLVSASESGNVELVKFILGQEGIDINAKDIYLFLSKFILIILDFKMLFGI